MITLLVHFSNHSVKLISWICSLLFDVIKWKHELNSLIINIDQLRLIKILSKKYSFKNLNQSIRSWMKCRHKLITINGINHELIILEQLLYWEYILNIFK